MMSEVGVCLLDEGAFMKVAEGELLWCAGWASEGSMLAFVRDEGDRQVLCLADFGQGMSMHSDAESASPWDGTLKVQVEEIPLPIFLEGGPDWNYSQPVWNELGTELCFIGYGDEGIGLAKVSLDGSLLSFRPFLENIDFLRLAWDGGDKVAILREREGFLAGVIVISVIVLRLAMGTWKGGQTRTAFARGFCFVFSLGLLRTNGMLFLLVLAGEGVVFLVGMLLRSMGAGHSGKSG